jgi:hypothetical protein
MNNSSIYSNRYLPLLNSFNSLHPYSPLRIIVEHIYLLKLTVEQKYITIINKSFIFRRVLSSGSKLHGFDKHN